MAKVSYSQKQLEVQMIDLVDVSTFHVGKQLMELVTEREDIILNDTGNSWTNGSLVEDGILFLANT